MHDFVLKIFGALKSFWHFMKIVCVFCIIMLLLFWIQNLTHAHWEWLGFITPFLNGLLDVANNIYSISFNIWGAEFELKYLSAVIILLTLYLVMNLLIILTCVLESGYKSTHFICKKTEELVINKNLKDRITKEEKKIRNYVITVHTQIKPKFNHKEININLDEQNKLMVEFLEEKLSKKSEEYDGGYRYTFDDFDKIDAVLEVFFKVLHSTAPIEYAICVQVLSGQEQINELKKLISLKHFGKITMAADTSYRYRYNQFHRYQTSQIGIFQNGDKTLEVHEFKEFS